MATLTRDGITAILGQVDDRLVAEIIGTGVSLGELAKAKAWLGNDEALINAGQPFPAGRVGALVGILTRAEEEDAPAVTATDEY
jgi:hypothetical protein